MIDDKELQIDSLLKQYITKVDHLNGFLNFEINDQFEESILNLLLKLY